MCARVCVCVVGGGWVVRQRIEGGKEARNVALNALPDKIETAGAVVKEHNDVQYHFLPTFSQVL